MSPSSGATRGSGHSGQPRMLRIEYKGQPYDWFNLDEMGDIVRTSDFANTLRENIAHYFGVPYEFQAVYDEEGLLSSVVDFARALRSVRPWLRVYDVREMVPELKEKTTQQLEDVHAEVLRSKQCFGFQAPVNSARGSPPRTTNSMADAVRNANESGLGGPYGGAFPWSGTGMQAASLAPAPESALERFMAQTAARDKELAAVLPNPVANSASPRYATPPPLKSGLRIPGVVPTPPVIPGVAPAMTGISGTNGSSSWALQPSPVIVPPSPLSVTPPQAWRNVQLQSPVPPQVPQPQTALPQLSQLQSLLPQTGLNLPATSTPPRPTLSPVGSARDFGRQGCFDALTAAVVPSASVPSTAPASASQLQQDRSSWAPVSGAASEDEPCLEVRLSKEPPFERFGFANVPSRDGRALLISWVDPNGQLEVKWNRKHQDMQVSEGDKIMAVNSVSGAVEDMREQLQKEIVVLSVQRDQRRKLDNT